jgi:hypothetical protein
MILLAFSSLPRRHWPLGDSEAFREGASVGSANTCMVPQTATSMTFDSANFIFIGVSSIFLCILYLWSAGKRLYHPFPSHFDAINWRALSINRLELLTR